MQILPVFGVAALLGSPRGGGRADGSLPAGLWLARNYPRVAGAIVFTAAA